MSGKYKHLLKNMGFITLSQFGTKILSFLMVPLYTSILTTQEYGIYDLFSTIVSFSIPVLTLNITSALIRFPIDGEDDPKEIFSEGMFIILKGIAIFGVFIILNIWFNVFPLINDFPLDLVLMFITSIFYESLCLFARGLDNIFSMSCASVINSLFTLSLNIFFLVFMKLGLKGYFCANILGTLLAIIFLLFRLHIWNYIIFPKRESELKKRMLQYTIPMVANSISWWVNSSLDRLVIVGFYSVSANGVYSAASKIPGIIQIIQNIFGQAWSLSAAKFFDSEDRNGFFTYVYGTYNMILVIGCSIVIMTTKVLSKVLYSAEFYQAWQYVPFLCIAVVFTALAGYVGGIFTAIKKSSILGITTIGSAALNCLLNFTLIYYIGVIGAAVSTMLSYYLMFLIRMYFAKHYIKIKVRLFRDHFAYLILLMQSILLFIMIDKIMIYLLQVLLVSILMILYWNEEKSILIKLWTLKLKRNR